MTDPINLAKGLITGFALSRKYQHEISWEGSRVPRHVSLGAHQDSLSPIVWTQHGLVYCGDQQDHVGEYRRVMDCGGENGLQQEMIVYTDLKTIAEAKPVIHARSQAKTEA